MKDQAKNLAKSISGPSARRLLRTAWAGTVVTVTAGGLLFTAAVNVPAMHVREDERDLPVQVHGPAESMTVGRAETVPQGVSLGQIVAVLERVAEQAREQGASFSPTVAQAASELGMLYRTYQMQQLVLGEQNEGLRVHDAPVARTSAKHDHATDDVAKPAQHGYTAAQVSTKRTSVIETHAEDPEAGYVTYDQLVIAAIRLTNLLDSSARTAQVEVQRADRRQGVSPREILALAEVEHTHERQNSSLREGLLDVVRIFSDSTLGYANGRIPAEVLCPLEFAPEHLLRCDAAQRLTALSDEFEREFGYPIPITDSYRSYVQQVAVASAKPHLAAIPGTSNHGWGLAVDLSDPIAGGASREYVWLRVHGPDYGWDNPSWARLGGAKPEPWHFEFFAAGTVPDQAIDPSDVGIWDPTAPYDRADLPDRPAPDRKPKDGPSADEVREPAVKPAREPSTGRPSQKPSKPTRKPTPSSPKPKPTTTTNSPNPSPSPSEPGQEPSIPPSPAPSEPGQEPSTSPSPTPSKPSPSPTPTPSEPLPSPTPSPSPSATPTPRPTPTPRGDGETTPSPNPSPSPSASSSGPSTLAKDLGLTVDRTKD